MKRLPKRGILSFYILTLSLVMNKWAQDLHWSPVMTPLTANGVCLCLSGQQYHPKNPFYVSIGAAKKVTGAIIAHQLRSLDYRARKATFIGKCPEGLLSQVLMRIEPIIF